MKQLPIPRRYKCKINTKRHDLPPSIKHLRPVVYKEGDQFCCLLGSDPQADLWGCGKTPESAMTDWDSQLKARIDTTQAGDRFVVRIKRILKSVQRRDTRKRIVEN